MDDADLLEAIRECESASAPATAERIARRLSVPAETVRERLATLEEDGRVERENGEGDGECEWTVAGDPRLEESVDRMRDRLGREPGRR